MEQFPGLVLLGAAVVIQGKYSAITLPGRQPEIDGGLATVAPDLQYRAEGQSRDSTAIQGLSLVLGEETLDVIMQVVSLDLTEETEIN